jgi:DNA-binding SARP family transcriptional activator
MRGLTAPEAFVQEGSRLVQKVECACPVRIHTLGRFSVQLHGQSVSNSAKSRYQRPLELLQALIALGGRDVHAELLSQALWPDTEGDKAQNAFDVNLHRLRQLLDFDALVLVRDRRLTLNSDMAWVDAWAFERLVNEAERLIARIGEPGVAGRLARCEEQLLALYQGGFLEREATRTWSLSLRERLRSKLLRHMHEAGPAWERLARWETAIRYYQKGLEIDPLIETLYRRLMCCYSKTGRVAEALATYRRCRTIMAEQFGIQPSQATRELYRALRN